jgi:integrase/recombinase XerD
VTRTSSLKTMPKHNPENARIKRQYFVFLKEAKRQSEESVDAAAKAIARFEEDTRHRDFKAFHFEQAVAFKRRIGSQDSQVTGGKLSKATLHATFGHLKKFFQWLAFQPGYRSQIRYSDTEYFNNSDKDARVATARRERVAPTVDQVLHVLEHMPKMEEIPARNRALIAFALLTGARDSAIASFRLKHVDLTAGSVYQDARDVRTKFSKSFTTHFFPVGTGPRQIVAEWVGYLRTARGWGGEDPLFPATRLELDQTGSFRAAGIDRKAWSTASPIRAIFKQAFESAGLPYFNPHSFRRTLVQLGEKICHSPEEFKAWSQNLGHEGVLTTFCSYGSVSPRRQGDIIGFLGQPREESPSSKVEELAEAVARAIKRDGLLA